MTPSKSTVALLDTYETDEPSTLETVSSTIASRWVSAVWPALPALASSMATTTAAEPSADWAIMSNEPWAILASWAFAFSRAVDSMKLQPSGSSNAMPKKSFTYSLGASAASPTADAVWLAAAALEAAVVLAACALVLAADALAALDAAELDALDPHAVNAPARASVMASAAILVMAFIMLPFRTESVHHSQPFNGPAAIV